MWHIYLVDNLGKSQVDFIINLGFFFDKPMLTTIWLELGWPLLRIIFFVSVGLLVANFIESLNWTHRMAVIARPLTRIGRFSEITGASFSMAFFSGVSANSMLAEVYDEGRISKRELVLANLFNSLPRFFLHLPTVFFLTVPFIKGAALIYVGLTFIAALLQTLVVVILGRLLLPKTICTAVGPVTVDRKKIGWREALSKSRKRFKKRIVKILKFTVPVYTLFFLLSRTGFFGWLETLIAQEVWLMSWLHPKSISIVVLHVTAEFSAGLAAAGALLADKSLSVRDVVLALLAGNILAAPVRALRHQYPYYIGIFKPRLAAELVGYSQVCRLLTILLVGVGYAGWTAIKN